MTSRLEPSLLIAAIRSREDRPIFLNADAGDSMGVWKYSGADMLIGFAALKFG